VSSSDAYSDLWTPFFTLFWRNWPDCPYPVYLGVNQAQFDHARVQTLNAGADESWSKNLRLFLSRIDSDYVLFLLEDFFFIKRVPTALVSEQLNALHSLGGTMLRLFPNPPPHAHVNGYDRIGSVHRFAPFRVSAQAALWKRSEFAALLVDGESPWDFEKNGTLRSQSLAGGFYCTYKPVIPYIHVIEQGLWFRSAARRFGRANIGCNFAMRGTLPASVSAKKTVHSLMRYFANETSGLRLRVQRGARPCQESHS
jgi:hypothetical protein